MYKNFKIYLYTISIYVAFQYVGLIWSTINIGETLSFNSLANPFRHYFWFFSNIQYPKQALFYPTVVSNVLFIVFFGAFKDHIFSHLYQGSKHTKELTSKKAKELSNIQNSIIVGYYGKDNYICDAGQGHVLLRGPTSSGKSTTIIIPSILNWNDSIFVTDPKSELLNLTADYRKTKGECYNLSFLYNTSAKFNVLDEVRKGELEAIDSRNIAEVFVRNIGQGDKLNFWEESAVSFLQALILYSIYCCKDKSMPGIFDLISSSDFNHQALFEMMIEACSTNKNLPKIIKKSAQNMLDNNEKVILRYNVHH